MHHKLLAQPDPIAPTIVGKGGLYIDLHERLVDRLRWPLMIAVIVLYLAGYNTAWRYQPDSALYLEIGRNIAEGHGFTYHGVPNRLAYPGLPYLLATIHRVAPWHVIPVANAVMLLITLASLAATYRLIYRAAGRSKAVAITFILAQTVVFMKMSFSILTDMPFFLAVQACLLGCECTGWLAQKPIGTDAPPRTAVDRRAGWLLVVLGLILATLMRPMMLPFIGALVAAVSVDAIRRRRFGAALVSTLMIAMVAIAIYTLDPRRSVTGMDRYEEQVIQRVSNVGQWLRECVGPNLLAFCHNTLPMTFFGFSFTLVGDFIVSGVLLSLCLWLLRVRPVWALWVLATTFTMVGVVPSSRYLLPLMPILLLAWWNLARYANLRLGRGYGGCVAFAIITLLLPGMVRSWGTVWSEQIARPFVASYHLGRYQAVDDMAKLIRQHTPPNAVVAIIVNDDTNAGILTYLTRRQVVETWDAVVPALAPRPVFVITEEAATVARAMLAPRGLRAGEAWSTPDYDLRDQIPLTLHSTSWRYRALFPPTAPMTRPAANNALPLPN